MRRHWREQFKFDRLEWVAIGVIGITVLTRFWVIRDQPYPAWTDSLHHAILTQLTAVQGRLPTDMQPYFPISLAQYHLGLYALSASVQWLAQVPAYTAVLDTAQFLNGLCGLGVYLVLDRKAGRLGALTGLVVVGLFSPLPAVYVNWGRFTQLASQTIMLIAWLVTWEVLATWRSQQLIRKFTLTAMILSAVLLNASVFLFHFRAAGFYLPLIGLTVVYEVQRAWRSTKFKALAVRIALIGASSLLCITPTLLLALPVFLSHQTIAAMQAYGMSAEDQEQIKHIFFNTSLKAIPSLTVGDVILVIGVASSIWGLIKRSRFIILYLLWMICLIFLGEAYLINIGGAILSNLSGILILFYLPIGLVVGTALHEIVSMLPSIHLSKVVRWITVILLITGCVTAYFRATEVEPYRFFVTPSDVRSMQWIEANTSPNAIFAINTTFWMPNAPLGTDAGYWIPYFSGRQTTAGNMLLDLAAPQYISKTLMLSHLVIKLAESNEFLDELHNAGVQYIYIGARGNPIGRGLDVVKLTMSNRVVTVFRDQGTTILRIK